MLADVSVEWARKGCAWGGLGWRKSATCGAQGKTASVAESVWEHAAAGRTVPGQAPPAADSHDSRGLATAEVGLGPTLRILSNIKLLISISTGCE